VIASRLAQQADETRSTSMYSAAVPTAPAPEVGEEP
jgi:hypothetical protein